MDSSIYKSIIIIPHNFMEGTENIKVSPYVKKL